jgi:hypothetical protein
MKGVDRRHISGLEIACGNPDHCLELLLRDSLTYSDDVRSWQQPRPSELSRRLGEQLPRYATAPTKARRGLEYSRLVTIEAVIASSGREE